MKSRTIWLVSDEKFILEALGLVIGQGFPGDKLEEFLSGLDAWNELTKRSPDLLITGDVMPGLRGEELALRLHERSDRLPVIVTSAWEPTRVWVDALKSKGMNIQMLALPMAIGDLLDSIHRAWGDVP